MVILGRQDYFEGKILLDFLRPIHNSLNILKVIIELLYMIILGAQFQELVN